MSSESDTTTTISQISQVQAQHEHCVNFHHLSRSQFEKIINLRINAQFCHDVKCMREKEYFQTALAKIAKAFNEIYAQVEKQRRDLVAMYEFHTKICSELGFPNKNAKPNEWDNRKLKNIAMMIREQYINKTVKLETKVTEADINENSSNSIVPPREFAPCPPTIKNICSQNIVEEPNIKHTKSRKRRSDEYENMRQSTSYPNQHKQQAPVKMRAATKNHQQSIESNLEMLNMIFWPITDDEDVEETDDWECCCGTIHSLFGALLFMFFDMLALPIVLSAGIVFLYHNNERIGDVIYFAPMIALSVAIITSISGSIAFIRLYLCLYTHVCSEMHKVLIVNSMRIYFARVILFTLFSICMTGYLLRIIMQGCRWVDCLKKGSFLTLWAFLTFNFMIGCCLCYKALGFMKNRYLGIWDMPPKSLDNDIFDEEKS